MSAIEVYDLKKTYGETRAVDGLSFQVESGEVFGLLGPNGAGKTTTVEMIEGLRTPDSGSIRVLNLDPKQALKQIKNRIGIQLQTTALYPRLTVREVIDLFASFFSGARPYTTDDLIKLVGLEEKAKTRSKELSGGQKQRLSVALALVNDPEIVFLDEPTTGMDPQARRNMWDVIESLQQHGKTVLLTTHYMEEAETLCQRVAVIDHGKIIALDSPEELIRQNFKETAIEFSDPGTPDQDRLQALPTVSQIAVKDHQVLLYSLDVPQTMAGLMDLSKQQALKFRDMSVRNATLEDVFLKLTGRSIRD